MRGYLFVGGGGVSSTAIGKKDGRAEKKESALVRQEAPRQIKRPGLITIFPKSNAHSQTPLHESSWFPLAVVGVFTDTPKLCQAAPQGATAVRSET